MCDSLNYSFYILHFTFSYPSDKYNNTRAVLRCLTDIYLSHVQWLLMLFPIILFN